MKKLLVITLWLILASVANSQEKIRAVIHCYNSSVVHGTPELASIKLDTKYGKSEIPLKDILRVDVGYHVEADLQIQIEKALKDLGSTVHLTREVADKFLRDNYEHSFFPLNTFKSDDREVSKRAEEILVVIRSKHDPRVFNKISEDIVYLQDGQILKGKIIGASKFELTTKNMGKVAISLSGIREISIINHHNELSVKPDETWQSTTFYVSGKFTIKAWGEVDLFPTDATKYLSGPNGRNEPGLNNVGKAGVLMVKYNGNSYICGENFLGETSTITKLEFFITPAYWARQNDILPMSGQYYIKIER